MKNHTRLTILTLALIGVVSLPSVAADEVKIETRMSQQELTRSGLNKLTTDELNFLNLWLQSNDFSEELSADIPAPALPVERNKDNDTSMASAERDYERAKAALNAPRKLQIKGPFNGWSGDTYFFMTNGEIWQQRTNRRYSKKLDSPIVKIYKNRLGFFEMEVIETGKKVGVRRIKQD